jgi:hypothetical protein
MKKYVVSLMAVLVVIISSSFKTSDIKSVKKEKATQGARWYNFNGVGLFDMCDPSMYSPDENNWPDCPLAVGLIYCEILAQPSESGDDEPNLFTISNYRMRQIL